MPNYYFCQTSIKINKNVRKEKTNELLPEVLYLPAKQSRQSKSRPFTGYKIGSKNLNYGLLT